MDNKTTPSPDPAPSPSKSKLPLVLLVIVLLFLFGFGGILLGKYFSDLNSRSTAQTVISPTSTPAANQPTQTVETGYKETLSIFGLTFKPPASWWSEKRLDSSGELGEIFLDAKKVSFSPDGIPIFSVRANANKEMADYERYMALSQYGPNSNKVQERPITLSGETGTILEGMTRPGMLPSFSLRIVMISHNGIVYRFMDYAPVTEPKYESLFDQILSTFKFLD